MANEELLNDVAAGGTPPNVGSALFGWLADHALEIPASELSSVRLKGGEMLFASGDAGDSLYVVRYGRLRAMRPDGPDGPQVLGEIGRGESVGEMALLTGEARSATVYAIRDTELVRLRKETFERMVERHPRLMLEMARLIIERYRRMIGSPQDARPATLAILPCDAEVPTENVAAGLARALSPGRKVLTLDLERLRRKRGGTTERVTLDLESPELAAWLHEQEDQHDYLVYVADPLPSTWTRLCLRQADILLLVGTTDAAHRMEPGLVELIGSSSAGTWARKELVLLYDSGAHLPHGTAEWLARVNAHNHHHLDPDMPAHYERLARMLTGRAIGLVLGGGGARGLAHIGVIRALEEARIPVDLVGGTSAGAIIAGQVACGWESARIFAESRRVLVDDGPMNDFTLPLVALLRGRRYARAMEKLFGDRRIEDLPLGFFCVSTNLTRSTCMVHRSGLVFESVVASCSVPGLAPPSVHGRDILVDGGVVNNVPVDVMRDLNRGPVFASKVSPQSDLCLDQQYTALPSPWRLLASRLNPFGSAPAVPSIVTTLMRTVSLPRLSAGVDTSADLVFEAPCDAYQLLEWRAIDRIVESGYRAAVPVIERWQARRDSVGQPMA